MDAIIRCAKLLVRNQIVYLYGAVYVSNREVNLGRPVHLLHISFVYVRNNSSKWAVGYFKQTHNV